MHENGQHIYQYICTSSFYLKLTAYAALTNFNTFSYAISAHSSGDFEMSTMQQSGSSDGSSNVANWLSNIYGGQLFQSVRHFPSV